MRIRFAPLNSTSVNYFNITGVATVRIGKIADIILYVQVVCVMSGREPTDRKVTIADIILYPQVVCVMSGREPMDRKVTIACIYLQPFHTHTREYM